MNFSFWNLFCTLSCIFIYDLSCYSHVNAVSLGLAPICVNLVLFGVSFVAFLADGMFMCICDMLLRQRRLPQTCVQRSAARRGRGGAGLQVLRGGCGEGRCCVVSRSTGCSVTTSSPRQFHSDLLI